MTPPQALLLAGDPPLQIPLTVRRSVSPWQYVAIPAICGGALAVLLVLVLIAIGVPGKGTPAKRCPGSTRPSRQDSTRRSPSPAGSTSASVLMLFLMHKRHELSGDQMPAAGARRRDGRRGGRARGGRRAAGGRVAGGGVAVAARPGAGAGQKVKRVRWGRGFWRTPLFAGAAWSFGDSWATSVTPLTALAGGVLTASGAVAGLVPGVDLTRIGLLMALVGGLTTIAPLLFGALNSLFPERKRRRCQAPTGEVTAASLWVMLLASCLTVFAIGAEIGFVGLVLGFNLIVVSPSIRWIGPAVTGLAAVCSSPTARTRSSPWSASRPAPPRRWRTSLRS